MPQVDPVRSHMPGDHFRVLLWQNIGPKGILPYKEAYFYSPGPQHFSQFHPYQATAHYHRPRALLLIRGHSFELFKVLFVHQP